MILLIISTAAVVHDIYSSTYLSRINEGISRTMLDLLMLDRLNKLEDKGAIKKLRLKAEVPLTINNTDDNGQNLIVPGQADWALGWDLDISEILPMLLVVEAKVIQRRSIGMPQLIIYMAAVQEARQDKTNRTVFGMLSDSELYYFACLDKSKKLSISEPMS